MQESFLILKGSLNKTGNGTVNMVNNAGAFLFDSVKFELYGQIMEYVRDPGRISTTREYLRYDLNSSKDLG